MIDPRLRTLQALHEQGTVTAAAEMLHLTPSTVSQQLRQLSARAGVTLLEPQGRRVRLTPAALTLLRHADVMFAQWERARADLAAHGQGTAGHLRISGIATAITSLILPATEDLRQRFPHMTWYVGEDATENRYELLMADRTDIAVVIPTPDGPPPDDPRFAQHQLLEEPLDLLVPAAHPLAARAHAELSETAAETWIRAGDPVDQHQLLIAACAAAGFTPRVRHNAIDWYAIAALVERGRGIALLPRLAPVPREYEVVRVPLHGEHSPVRRLVTCVRRGSDAQPPIAHGLAALRRAAASWSSGREHQ